MKNRKGFTLVELLAVIAILAIIVIFATPKVIQLFNNARRSAFDTEIRTLYKQAKSDFMATSITDSSPKKFCDPKTKEIRKDCKELNINTSSEYLIEIDSNGNIDYIGVDNGTFVYGAQDDVKLEDIKLEDIKQKVEETSFEIISENLTQNIPEGKYNNIEVVLNSISATTAGTPKLVVDYKSVLPTIDLLPKREYTVKIDKLGNYEGSSHIVNYDLLGFFTSEKNGKKIIDSNGRVIPSVTGYTDSNGKWLRTKTTSLYAQWKPNSVKVPNIGCTSDIFTSAELYYKTSKLMGNIFPNTNFTPTEDTTIYHISCYKIVNFIFRDATMIESNGLAPIGYNYNFYEGRSINNSFDVINKPGYTSTGWYTQKEGGVKLLDENGKILANVEGYTDSNKAWISKQGSFTLYSNWTINTPSAPTISGGGTSIYGATNTKLTCSTTSTGVPLYYSFGYSYNDTNEINNWTTPSNSNTIFVDEFIGNRYYDCRVYASDKTQTSSTVVSKTRSLVKKNNASILFNPNGGTNFHSGVLYTRKGSSSLYDGIQSSKTVILSKPTLPGATFLGWYTAPQNGMKVINPDGTLVNTAQGYVSNGVWIITSNKSLYAVYSGIPVTYTGSALIRTGSTAEQTINNTTFVLPKDSNWYVKLIDDGVLKITGQLGLVDLFIVGGGGGGGAPTGNLIGAAGGGGGGFKQISKGRTLSGNYSITIGKGGQSNQAGGKTIAFGITVNGGNPGAPFNYGSGGNGTSMGGNGFGRCYEDSFSSTLPKNGGSGIGAFGDYLIGPESYGAGGGGGYFLERCRDNIPQAPICSSDDKSKGGITGGGDGDCVGFVLLNNRYQYNPINGLAPGKDATFYGGGGGGATDMRSEPGINTTGGKGYQGIVIIRNHRE